MKARLTVFAALIAAAAAFSAWRLSSGVDADLYSLAETGGGILSEVSKGASGSLRVLCEDESRAAKCRAAFKFDEPVDVQAVLEYYRTHGDGLLAAKSRALLEAGDVERIRRSAKRRDFSGMGLFPKADDPFYLLSDFVADLKSMIPEGAADGSVILAAAVPGAPDAETADGMRRLVDLARNDGGIYLSGAPFHTLIATEKTKREINILGTLSLAAVLLLGLALFRSARFILPTFLSLAAAFAAGTFAVCLLPGKPHALTFLFGTSLAGLGVDYCYHALSAAGESRRDFAKRLTGALATTLFAFAPLLFSRIPILRQMSVFTMAGLATVYACAILFLRGTEGAETGGGAKPRLSRRASISAAIALLLATAPGIAKFAQLATHDPDAFHTPDPVMARGEAKFASLLGSGGGCFTVVEGANLQEALEREESLGIDGLSRLMPSLKRQKENFALKSALEPGRGGTAAIEPSFIEEIPPPLATAANAMLVKAKGKVYLLSPNGKTPADAPAWARRLEPRTALAGVFMKLSSETMRLLAASFAAMTLALVILFRGRFVCYGIPLASAAIATAGTLGWLGEPVTFFHGICFLMIWGIGIDYAIFNLGDESGATRRTVLFCLLSSLAGFGMLAFTSFHGVAAMGKTLATGLAYCYVFSLLTPRPQNARRERAQTEGWSGQTEQSAGRLRILLMWHIYRLLGKSAAKLLFLPAFAFIYPFCRPARDALRSFYGVLNAHRERLGMKRLRFIEWRIMKQTLGFAWSMLDKTDACSLCKNPPRFTVTGDTGWMDGGAFLLSSHLGCIEVLPALGKRLEREGRRIPKVHAFQQLGHDAVFTSIFVKSMDKSNLALHAVEDIGVETAVEMKEAVDRGEIVLMAGDRLSAADASGAARRRKRRSSHRFLGVQCSWPQGVFRFAELMEAPVYAAVCIKTGWNSCEVRSKKLDGDILAGYVGFLEEETMRNPGEWYQFYRFFG